MMLKESVFFKFTFILFHVILFLNSRAVEFVSLFLFCVLAWQQPLCKNMFKFDAFSKI